MAVASKPFVAFRGLRGTLFSPFLAALCLFLLSTVCGLARAVYLEPDTALFLAPSADSSVIGVLPEFTQVEPLESRIVVLAHNPATPGRQHPLTLRTEFYRIRTPGGGEAWVSPDLLYDPVQHRLVPYSVPSRFMEGVVLGAVIAFVLLLWWAYGRGDLRRLVRPAESVSRYTLVIWGAILVGLYLVLLSLIRFLSGQVIAAPTDEIQYFGIAKDILAWHRPVHWCFNISVALLYIPFILVLHAKRYLDIARPLVFTEAAVLTPLCYVLVFSILGRLMRCWRQAFLTVVLLMLLPMVYCPVELHALAPGLPSVFKAVVSLPLFNAASYHLYYLFVWYGRNGLSDTPSATLALLTVWLCIRGLEDRSGRWRHIVFTSAVFGLACLMRINNVFLAPLVAYCFWEHMTGGSWSWPRLWAAVGLALAVFLAVFWPQFLANFLEFGSIFTFPYVLHTNHAAEGFRLSALRSGTNFLVGTNFAYVVWAVTGLAVASRDTWRRVIAFWVAPMFLFFCGYVVVGASPMRFILPLYGGIIGVFACASFWREAAPRQRLAAVLLIAANVALVSPCARFAPPYALGLNAAHGATVALFLEVAVPIVSVALVLLFFKPPLRRVMLLFLLLYHLGSTHLLGACLAVLLARELVLWLREVLAARCPTAVSSPAPESTAA